MLVYTSVSLSLVNVSLPKGRGGLENGKYTNAKFYPVRSHGSQPPLLQISFLAFLQTWTVEVQ